MNQRLLTMTSIAAIVAAMSVAGCSKRDQTDARSSSDQTVAQVDQKSRDVSNDAASGMDKAKSSARNMTQDAKDKVSDAVITSTVKAELAKDSSLSAIKINVDTDNGQVALRGSAPSPDAREHATMLAQNVKGVVGVDNQLTVEPTKN
jgi:osmotically-inducible protein OsmY